MTRIQFAILIAILAVTPVMAECNTAPTVATLEVEAYNEPLQVDVLAAASDAEGHPLSVFSPSTTCDATVAVDFDLLTIAPNSAIRTECAVSFIVEDELGETATGTVSVRVIPSVFTDTFESGSTDTWTEAG